MVILMTGSTTALAQSNKVTFNGAGRMIVDNAKLGGTLLDTDTTSQRREMNGAALFDFGIDIRPNENTQIHSVMRVQNEIDGFWGAGIIFQLRELYAQGVIADALKYRVGDIDAALTPYTLWNSNSEFRFGEAAAFDVFRDIIDYENFYADSTWRQQGVEAEWGLDFSDGFIDRMTFRGLISKNRQTDFFTLPDRLFGLARVGIESHPTEDNPGYWALHGNFVNLFEVAEAAQFNTAERQQRSFSGDLRYRRPMGENIFGLDAEAGGSSVVFTDLNDAPDENLEDFFVDVALSLTLPESNLQFRLGISDVGADYRAPGAQSRRLAPNDQAQSFTYYTNRETLRPLNVADLIRDPSVYNRTVDDRLGAYSPVWDNVRPYGQATPNRRGVDLDVMYTGDSLGRFDATFSAAYLSEIVGEGTANLRSFLDLHIGGNVHLAPVISWERVLDLYAGIRYQSTSRDGTEGVDLIDLTSLQLEAGLNWEVYDNLDVLAGVIMLSASGNEFVADRDPFTVVDFYEKYEAEVSELFFTGGLRYRFSETISLSAQFQSVNSKNALIPENDYTTRHALLLYNMFF